ncbi:MAG: hypothetical protein OXE48_03550 [Gammaproteobacteria bacterium]|nr:hypothetical protein [Gammaproteobacteria bacterium]
MRWLAAFAVAALVATVVAAPGWAEDTGFDFNAWLDGVSKANVLEVEIKLSDAIPNADTATYCEDRNGFNDGWCNGSYAPLFVVELKPGQQRSDVSGDLRIGIEWATAVGETGYGTAHGTPVSIPANQYISNPFTIAIPDDNITHRCNKLIVSMRSLTPSKYKIAPFHDGGSIFIEYVDNDGENVGRKPCEP